MFINPSLFPLCGLVKLVHKQKIKEYLRIQQVASHGLDRTSKVLRQTSMGNFLMIQGKEISTGGKIWHMEGLFCTLQSAIEFPISCYVLRCDLPRDALVIGILICFCSAWQQQALCTKTLSRTLMTTCEIRVNNLSTVLTSQPVLWTNALS